MALYVGQETMNRDVLRRFVDAPLVCDPPLQPDHGLHVVAGLRGNGGRGARARSDRHAPRQWLAVRLLRRRLAASVGRMTDSERLAASSHAERIARACELSRQSYATRAERGRSGSGKSASSAARVATLCALA